MPQGNLRAPLQLKGNLQQPVVERVVLPQGNLRPLQCQLQRHHLDHHRLSRQSRPGTHSRQVEVRRLHTAEHTSIRRAAREYRRRREQGNPYHLSYSWGPLERKLQRHLQEAMLQRKLQHSSTAMAGNGGRSESAASGSGWTFIPTTKTSRTRFRS